MRVQDIGSPYSTLVEAENKLAQLRKTFQAGPQYVFNIREVPDKPESMPQKSRFTPEQSGLVPPK